MSAVTAKLAAAAGLSDIHEIVQDGGRLTPEHDPVRYGTRRPPRRITPGTSHSATFRHLTAGR